MYGSISLFDNTLITSIRATGTFNQLGYAGIISLSKNIGIKLFMSLYLICIFLAIASLSKAAMIAILFVLVNKKDYKVLFLLFMGFVLFLIINIENFRFMQRILDIGSDSDDNLEGRGLLLNPDFRIIFGYGEGFMYPIHEGSFLGEVHSTLGGILINYGIFGIFKVSTIKFGLMNSFLPFMLYGLTHNGIRFTIFWIFLALIYSINK